MRMAAGRNPAILTIGYEGRSPDEFFAMLRDAGADALVDVRIRTASRKKGFSKSALRERCRTEGIDYAHVHQFGTPPEMMHRIKASRKRGGEGFTDQEAAAYREHLLSEGGALLEQLAAHLADRRPCLLCFEKDHRDCHRQVVAEELRKRTGQGVEHL